MGPIGESGRQGEPAVPVTWRVASRIPGGRFPGRCCLSRPPAAAW